MTARSVAIAFALGLSLVAAVAAIDPERALAQSSTTGAIQGVVSDEATGEKLAGVTVVVTSPALQSSQTEITDENGFYKISALPPGDYKVTFYFNQLTVEHTGVNVGVNKTTPVFQALKLSLVKGEIVEVKGAPPTIDPTSTTQGITLDKNYLRNIPVPGRTFDTALGAAAGSQNDGVGVSFSGSSSLENQYVVDGVNTTGLTFGTVGSPVINDFIEEIEVITGGYNAEYGRATGGVVNVVTKSGSNELKGSIFGTVQPGFLTAPALTTPVNASSLEASANNAYIADVGFELGGPIIKDRAWFFVGFAPQLSRTDITRTTTRETDCRKLLPSGQLSSCDPRLPSAGGNADTRPDVDPKTGFFITDTLDSEIRSDSAQAYNLLAKLNFAATPENQLQIALQATPRYATDPGIFGLASSGTKSKELTTDLSAKWTSKFNDNKTEIEGVIGWHRDHVDVNSINAAAQNQPLQALTDGSLYTWAQGFGGESQKTLDGCRDGGGAGVDAYPLLATNCPMNSQFYLVGGPGALTNDTEQRLFGSLAVTERVKALGSHEIKAGMDIENNQSDKARLFSGGAFIQNFVSQNDIRINRWVQLEAPGGMDPRFDQDCSNPTGKTGVRPGQGSGGGIPCAFIGGSYSDPGTEVAGSTLNWSAFLRDSWQVLPNLTLNLGVRYEEQRLRYASFLQHTEDPLTQVQLGKNAMDLNNMWAPRLGAIYDWTHEGRSKVYAHWGRFYESIPLDINERSFGGEVSYVQDYSTLPPGGGKPPPCGTTDGAIGGANGANCMGAATTQQLIGQNGVLVAPGIKPQYLDEFVVGAEYEVFDDLKVGLSYQNRRLGRVIEDVSTDGANTYIIANPGEWSGADENALKAKIDATMDPTAKAQLQHQLALFQGIRIFDKPVRDYNAVQLTVTRRFSKALYLQGSYTYSRTMGNYPGLVSYDNGQIDPNISSQYDLIELLANRQGPLPQDRPHYFKLDGYYTFDLQRQGAITVGARIRAFSGTPENALGSHYLYGANESFLLPRGELGRSEFDHGIDLHIEYARRLSPTMEASVFVDVFNIYDSQGTAAIDQTYAPPVSLGGKLQNANPISGGDYSDLIWLKAVDAKGNESSQPIGRNPNFGNTAARYAPAFGRLGARLTF